MCVWHNGTWKPSLKKIDMFLCLIFLSTSIIIFASSFVTFLCTFFSVLFSLFFFCIVCKLRLLLVLLHAIPLCCALYWISLNDVMREMTENKKNLCVFMLHANFKEILSVCVCVSKANMSSWSEGFCGFNSGFWVSLLKWDRLDFKGLK